MSPLSETFLTFCNRVTEDATQSNPRVIPDQEVEAQGMFLWDASSLRESAIELEREGQLSQHAARILLSTGNGRVAEILAGMLGNAALHIAGDLLRTKQLTEAILIAIATIDDAAALSELFRLIANLLRFACDQSMNAALNDASGQQENSDVSASPLLAGFFSTAFLRGRLIPMISNTLNETLLERFLEATVLALRCSAIVGGPIAIEDASDDDQAVSFPFTLLSSGLSDLALRFLELWCQQVMLAAVKGGAGDSWDEPPPASDEAGPSNAADGPRDADVQVTGRSADLLLRCIEGIALLLDGEPYLPTGCEEAQARFIFEGTRLCHRANALCCTEACAAILGEKAGEIAASAAVTRSSLLDVMGEGPGDLGALLGGVDEEGLQLEGIPEGSGEEAGSEGS